MTVAIVDAHNDLLCELEHVRIDPEPFGRLWRGQLQAGGVVLQVCPLFGAQIDWLPDGALRHSLQQVEAFYRAIDESGGGVSAVGTKADLEPVERGESMGLMLSMEGVEPLGYDPTLIDLFWRLGVRMVSITHNRRNPFGEGLAEPGTGGLSRLGEELVDRMAELGMIIDLVHGSERTYFDTLERLDDSATVVVSHAGCRAQWDTPRNLSDEQMRALADRGGVMGMMLLPNSIDSYNRTHDRVADHVDHAVQVMGIDHVGMGGDFIAQVAETLNWRAPVEKSIPRPEGWSFSTPIDGLRGPDGYPGLIESLSRRGYSDDDLRKLGSENFMRVFRRGLPG